MSAPQIEATVTGGQIQGIVGAGRVVVIENLNFYSTRAVEEAADPRTDQPIPPCPYPGLAYFGPGDADLFFGRDTAIARLVAAIGRQSLTALVGASGSGKSSVVLAGLAPNLHAAGGWQFSYFRIGHELDRDPFLALARALVPLYVQSKSETERLENTNELAQKLRAQKLTLRHVFSDCRNKNKGRRILLIADQFEEVFTLVEGDEVRERFIDILLAGFPEPKLNQLPDISLVLTLRADFVGRALLHRPLTDALRDHVEYLGPMNREELQTAVVRPAENSKVSFDPGLAETLLDEVESRPGSLPLLQFALREMWGRQGQRRITRKSYDDIGGVEGALAQRAEAIFATATNNGANHQIEQAFRRLFTRLVTLGEGQQDTRRVVNRGELNDEDWSLAQRLAGEDNRLIVTNALGPARETAEVVHEALIRRWPKLVAWIDGDRAFHTWLRQIRSNVELWSVDPSDDGPLLRGGMLAPAREWLDQRRDDLSTSEKGYIEASLTLQRRAEVQREAARQAEIRRQEELAEAATRLAAEQKERAEISARMASQAKAAADLELNLRTVAEASAVEAARLQRIAEGERDIAEKAKLAAQSARHRLWIALLSSILLLIGVTIAGIYAELQRKAANQERQVADQQRSLAIEELAAAQLNESRFLTGMAETELRNADPELAALTGLAALPVDIRLPDRPLWPPTVGVLALARNLDHARAVLVGHPKWVDSAAWSPDGTRIATASSLETSVHIWDARSGALLAVLEGHTDSVNSTAWSPDGTRIATSSQDSTARIWDAKSGAPLSVLKVPDRPYSAAWSPDGTRIATASEDHTARIWDAKSGAPLAVLEGHTNSVTSAAWSPDGTRIATASYDSTARIWDVKSGAPLAVLKDRVIMPNEPIMGPIRSADWSPDGTLSRPMGTTRRASGMPTAVPCWPC